MNDEWKEEDLLNSAIQIKRSNRKLSIQRCSSMIKIMVCRLLSSDGNAQTLRKQMKKTDKETKNKTRTIVTK